MEEQGIAAAIDRAEDQRRATDVLATWQVSANPVLRRQAIRALARIAEPPIDAATDKALLRALGDEDLEVAGWAAYGLGWACKGKEEEHVKALAARATTLADADASVAMTRRDAIDAPATITYAIGRCGGPLAEGTLTGFIRGDSSEAEALEAAYALGSLSGKGPLSDEAMGALLDRALAAPASEAAAAALYPIGRLDRVPGAWTARVLGAARGVLAAASPSAAWPCARSRRRDPKPCPISSASRRPPASIPPSVRRLLARSGGWGAPDARGPRPPSRA